LGAELIDSEFGQVPAGRQQIGSSVAVEPGDAIGGQHGTGGQQGTIGITPGRTIGGPQQIAPPSDAVTLSGQITGVAAEAELSSTAAVAAAIDETSITRRRIASSRRR
jgi:hypothetical protein